MVCWHIENCCKNSFPNITSHSILSYWYTFPIFTILLWIITSTFSFCFLILSLLPVTHLIEILVSSQFFNKKLLNIVISNLVSINPHVYNLVSGIFTIIKTIVGNVISLIFVFLRKYIFFIIYLYSIFSNLIFV